jgi:hypothetical protein
MKIYKITILFVFLSLGLNAQEIGVKTKRFCWGDSEVNFNQQLTKSGKDLLDSTLKMSKFDLTDCIKITSDEEIQYTSKEYLKNRKYQFITMWNYDGQISYRTYINESNEQPNQKKKVLLTYSKDNDNKIDRITLHIIE